MPIRPVVLDVLLVKIIVAPALTIMPEGSNPLKATEMWAVPDIGVIDA